MKELSYTHTYPEEKLIPSVLNEDKSVFETGNIEDNTGLLLLQVSNSWKNYQGKTLRKYHPLSLIQYAALANIYRLTLQGVTQITQSMFVEQTQMDTLAVERVLKGLEDKGYIYRETHPGNVKAKTVHFTREGKDLIRHAISTTAKVENKFFQTLNKNTRYFNNHLKKLLEANDGCIY